MKKVYIVTVFNSMNSGSFLQATSLYRAVESLGYDVAFLDVGARNLLSQALLEASFMLKKLDFKSAGCKFKMASVLKKELKAFKIEKLTDDIKNDEEAVFVLGSDEIWNIARKNMAAYPVFWGEGLNKKHCISYAPSLNNAKEEDLLKYSFTKDSIEKLAFVSARDKYSVDTLEKAFGRKIVQVCDPTLLMPMSYYESKLSLIKEKDYILVYAYSSAITDRDISGMKEFAKRHNKKLVAFGSNFKWADINVSGSPWDFLSYFYHADYVFTSTFHGTLFSSLFSKNYVVLGDKNKKVGELLDTFGLDRKADSEAFEAVFEKSYDKEKLTATIEDISMIGRKYLSDSINSIVSGEWYTDEQR